jgi:uncharacterized protein (DUF58 family)
MPGVAQEYRHYLDPLTLSKIASLDLRARTIVEGFLAGIHRSPNQGASVEFSQHRAYTQGDDIRRLDWKLFGRTDKLYVKQYVQETDLLCLLAVDVSESMAYRPQSGAWTKYDYATSLAAALAYLALQQRDHVGVAVFDESIRRWIRPSRQPQTWKTVIQSLHQAVGPRKTGIRAVLDDAAQRLERRALIVLISDLLDDPDEIISGLKHLRHRGHDVIVLHVLDTEELSFPFSGPMLFEGMEAGGRLLTDPADLREQYMDELGRFTGALRQSCRALQSDYELMATDSPLDVALSRFLATRAGGMQ